jgi:hypothetical protein
MDAQMETILSSQPNATDVPLLIESSRNSQVAKNGFRAERAICSQEDVNKSLELYFNKSIKCLTPIHSKKSDMVIHFTDGHATRVQNKDGDGKGRGFSVDRRKVEEFSNEPLTTLLKTMCLKQGTEKPVISSEISKSVITMCINGIDEKYAPEYFTHTTSDKTTGQIISMSICPTEKLMSFLNSEVYPVMDTMPPKRTCVHLSPNCYLQRKGGGKKDHAPDDIQMKFKFTEEVEKLFTPIFPQTMSQ